MLLKLVAVLDLIEQLLNIQLQMLQIVWIHGHRLCKFTAVVEGVDKVAVKNGVGVWNWFTRRVYKLISGRNLGEVLSCHNAVV